MQQDISIQEQIFHQLLPMTRSGAYSENAPFQVHAGQKTFEWTAELLDVVVQSIQEEIGPIIQRVTRANNDRSWLASESPAAVEKFQIMWMLGLGFSRNLTPGSRKEQLSRSVIALRRNRQPFSEQERRLRLRRVASMVATH